LSILVRVKLFLVTCLFLLSSNAFALSHCDDDDVELQFIQLGKKTGVMVCASSKDQIQTKFSVFRLVKDKERDLVFESDTTFKRYQVEKKNGKIHILEGLKEEGEFQPFVQFVINCEKGECKTKDIACVWKKQPTLDKVAEDLMAKEKFDDSDIQTMFIEALNGNPEAKKFFREDIKVEAGARVAFDTFKKDVERVGKFKCGPLSPEAAASKKSEKKAEKKSKKKT
jgi:hypothetical protein